MKLRDIIECCREWLANPKRQAWSRYDKGFHDGYKMALEHIENLAMNKDEEGK